MASGAGGGGASTAGVITTYRGRIPARTLGKGSEGRQNPTGPIIAAWAGCFFVDLAHWTKQLKFKLAFGTAILIERHPITSSLHFSTVHGHESIVSRERGAIRSRMVDTAMGGVSITRS